MFVNSYKIRKIEGDGIELNLPMGNAPWLADQDDIIQTKFVDVEVENSINPIFDYDTTKFLPKIGNTIANTITYKLYYLNSSNQYPTNGSVWADAGFTYNDFYFRKNSFTKTFLRLDFFDSDVGTARRLLFFTTLFPKVKNDSTGALIPPSGFNLEFTIGNRLINKNVNGEGFGLYYFKADIVPTVPKEIYMRASIQNAKDGSVKNLMTTNNPNVPIDILARTTIGTNNVNSLHTKYVLKRDVEGYYYEIDTTYSNNVSINGNDYIVRLYEISAS